jgi:hypothetical protein
VTSGSERNSADAAGEALGGAVTFMASVLPDVHRELLRVTDMGNLVARSRP